MKKLFLPICALLALLTSFGPARAAGTPDADSRLAVFDRLTRGTVLLRAAGNNTPSGYALFVNYMMTDGLGLGGDTGSLAKVPRSPEGFVRLHTLLAAAFRETQKVWYSQNLVEIDPAGRRYRNLSVDRLDDKGRVISQSAGDGAWNAVPPRSALARLADVLSGQKPADFFARLDDEHGPRVRELFKRTAAGQGVYETDLPPEI